MLHTGAKLREITTGEIWTVMPEQGHLRPEDHSTPERKGETYRIKNDASGQERLISQAGESHFERMS
jgi:hypothetical protein